MTEPGLPEIMADPERLIQALGSWVSNASRYTPPGGRITFTLSARREAAALVLAVADRGMGIAPEAQPHVFDLFYRSDPARNQTATSRGWDRMPAQRCAWPKRWSVSSRQHWRQTSSLQTGECPTAGIVTLP
jgi:light-regulated signal transduction histidine kinase (bacteriophytochrome)